MNYRIIPLILIILAVLAGCQTTGTTGSGGLYTGGTNGLIMSLVDQAPPSLVYDTKQTPFDIMVQAKNDGEFDVGWITFSINGISPDDFENLFDGGRGTDVKVRKRSSDGATFLVYDSERNPILGKTKLGDQILPGEERLITLAKDVTYTKELAGGGTLTFPFYITACYPYATIATLQLCTKTNYLNGDSKVCTPDTLKQMSVSGGPLQLVDYTQQAVGQKRLRLALTFKLKDNSGIYQPKGTTLDPNSIQTCKPASMSEDLREKNRFYVYIDTRDIRGASLTCSGLRQDPEVGIATQKILKTKQPNFGSGKSINIQIIISTLGSGARREGVARLNPDGTATITCTLDLTDANVATDAIRPVRVAAVYYARQDIAGEISVTHSES